MQSPAPIALIYFSRRVPAESRAKRWVRGSKVYQNRRIASLLDRRSQKAVQASGLPVFHYHEGNQQGHNFGQRLSQAMAEVMALGYQGVIVVGNDSPDLEQTDWEQVAAQLRAGQSVLGPSLRGGTYLIGLPRASFDAQALEALPWQTGRLFAALEAYCQGQAGGLLQLPTLRDVNSLRDLMAYAGPRATDSLWRRLIRWVLGLDTCYLSEWDERPIPKSFLTQILQRGPPQA